MTEIEWTHRKVRSGSRYEADTPLGAISIGRRALGNLGTGWRIAFPDDTHFIADTAEAAKAYAEYWLVRELARRPSPEKED